jgi:hypothetical protein
MQEAVGDIALAGVAGGHPIATLQAEGVGDRLSAFAFGVLAIGALAEGAFDFLTRLQERNDIALPIVEYVAVAGQGPRSVSV